MGHEETPAVRGLAVTRPRESTLHFAERDFLQAVRDLARASGWKTYHPLRSKGSEPGWPDLVLRKPPRLLVVELKTDRGKLTAEQAAWLEALEACGLQVGVWRPADWPTIEGELTARARPRSRGDVDGCA